MRTYVVFLLLGGMLSSCGIESSITATTDQPSQAERAVFITNIEVSATGSTVTCELNDALVSPDVEIPLFLEYEGNMIQQITLINEASFTFNEYNPPAGGNIVCVVEFANAEFESEPSSIQNSQ